MINIRNLSKKYELKNQPLISVLNQMNLQIEQGEFLALMGKSGSGKSTLLNIIGMLDQYTDGEYWFRNKLIQNISETEMANLRNRFIGFVFQSFHLLPFKTALGNVSLPLYYQKIGKRERIRKATEMLEKVGLGDRIKHKPNELSGGQKQRVAIARALVTDPELVLADEPTGALDSSISNDILDLLKLINSEGKTILLVTHDREVASKCGRIINIKDGKLN